MTSKEASVRTGGRGARSSATNYASTVATQSDVVKYRGKYKELKAKVKEIEMENDAIHLKTLNVKRTIQRMRLERAILYERLESTPGGTYDLPLHQTDSSAEEVGKSRAEGRGRAGADTAMDVDEVQHPSTASAQSQGARAGNGIKVTLRRNGANGS